jgi:hypothetical protein
MGSDVEAATQSPAKYHRTHRGRLRFAYSALGKVLSAPLTGKDYGKWRISF